jgi:hypothetical protein
MSRHIHHSLLLVSSLAVLSTSSAIGCSSPEVEETEQAEGNWTAVPGAAQATFRATTGEEIIVAFDPQTKSVPGRPECTTIVASPLRIRVYDRVSKAPDMTATIDSFVRGRTVAFTRDAVTSPGKLTLSRVSAVAYGVDVPELVLDKTCSGEPLDHFQSWSFDVGGRSLVDPIGDKPKFWSRLALASKTGVSATSNHAVELKATDGTKIRVAFRKLRGDDPSSPETCERTEAIPLRLTVETSAPASTVTIDMQSSWRSRTTASVTALRPSMRTMLSVTTSAATPRLSRSSRAAPIRIRTTPASPPSDTVLPPSCGSASTVRSAASG